MLRKRRRNRNRLILDQPFVQAALSGRFRCYGNRNWEQFRNHTLHCRQYAFSIVGHELVGGIQNRRLPWLHSHSLRLGQLRNHKNLQPLVRGLVLLSCEHFQLPVQSPQHCGYRFAAIAPVGLLHLLRCKK